MLGRLKQQDQSLEQQESNFLIWTIAGFISRLDLIKQIENRINYYRPEVVYVHHSGDVNVDHRRLHEAVITAYRPMPGQVVQKLLSYEVASSTRQPTGSALLFNQTGL